MGCPPRAEGENLLAWWSKMSTILPTLSRQALRMLRLPLTTCSVESSFSVYKMTRDPQQDKMDESVHIARQSFVFNGVGELPQ